MIVDSISSQIIKAAEKVHAVLGPGLAKQAYRVALAHELERRGLRAQMQMSFPVQYDGVTIECGYEVDLVVARSVMVQINTRGDEGSRTRQEMENCLRLSGKAAALILDFDQQPLVNGIEYTMAEEVADVTRFGVVDRTRRRTPRYPRLPVPGLVA